MKTLKTATLVAAITITAITINAANAKTNYGTVQVQRIVSVYDADTFRVNIKGWPPVIGHSMPIRANGFDAPEIRGQCPQEKALAQQAKQITLQALITAQQIELRNIKRGKYFRLIADVYIDGTNLKDTHLKAGTARPYKGGTRQGWCNPNTATKNQGATS